VAYGRGAIGKSQFERHVNGGRRLALAGAVRVPETCGNENGRCSQVVWRSTEIDYKRLYFTSKARKALSAMGFWGLRVSHSSTTFRAVSRSPIFT